MNPLTPTTLELLELGRDRIRNAWTRMTFVQVADDMMYFCMLGGLTPECIVDRGEVDAYWGLEADYSALCGIPNGMQCDATIWLADAIREVDPNFSGPVDRKNRLQWENAHRDDRRKRWYATTTQPRWSLDHALIVDWNDNSARSGWEVLAVYERAIANYRESLDRVKVHAAEAELAVSGD